MDWAGLAWPTGLELDWDWTGLGLEWTGTGLNCDWPGTELGWAGLHWTRLDLTGQVPEHLEANPEAPRAPDGTRE